MGKISRLTLILNIQKVPFSNVWILSLNETVTAGHHEAGRRPLSRYIFHKLAIVGKYKERKLWPRRGAEDSFKPSYQETHSLFSHSEHFG